MLRNHQKYKNKRDTSNIISILDANKIKYNRKFKKMKELNILDENLILTEDLIETIERLTLLSVNEGFRKNKKQLLKLINMCVGLTKRKSTKEINKIKKEKEKVMALFGKKEDVVMETDTPMRREIDKWIESTSAGVDVFIERNKDKELTLRNLNIAKDKMTAIRDRLNNITDFSSKRAADIAIEVVDGFMAFRGKAEQFEFDSSTIAYLDDVIKALDRWSKLKEGISIKNPKAGSLKEIQFIEKSSFNNIVRIKPLLEKVGIFKENIDEYERDLNRKQENSPILKNLNVKKEKFEELDKQIRETLIQAKNGRITKEQAIAKVNALKINHERLKKEIARDEKIAANELRDINNRMNILSRLQNIHYQIEGRSWSQSDLPFFIYLSEKLDFKAVNTLMRGFASSDQMKTAIDSLSDILLSANTVINVGDTIVDRLDESEDMIYEDQFQDEEVETLNADENFNDLLNQFDLSDEETNKNDNDTLVNDNVSEEMNDLIEGIEER